MYLTSRVIRKLKCVRQYETGITIQMMFNQFFKAIYREKENQRFL